MTRAGASKAFGDQSRLAALDRVLIAVAAALFTAPVWFPLAMLAVLVWGGR